MLYSSGKGRMARDKRLSRTAAASPLNRSVGQVGGNCSRLHATVPNAQRHVDHSVTTLRHRLSYERIARLGQWAASSLKRDTCDELRREA